MNNKEFCIMPNNPPYWYNERGYRMHRHEVFFGRRNRQKSIDDGLVVFLTPAMHIGTNGVHGKNGHKLDMELKKTAMMTWCAYYRMSHEDFMKRYHCKNYTEIV